MQFGIIIVIILSIIGCNKEDDNTEQEKSIVGNWQLIEIYSNPGAGSGNWNSVENGYTYSFSANGEFTSTRFSECSTGTYSIESNELSLDFDCDGFTTGIESPEGTFIEQLTFETKDLILKPTYLNCIEGCGWKFKKIN